METSLEADRVLQVAASLAGRLNHPYHARPLKGSAQGHSALMISSQFQG